MTETVRVAYSWTNQNKVQILHYGSRQWETGNDEDEALKTACTGLVASGISITEAPYEAPEDMEVRNPFLPTQDYPHRDVLSPGPNKSKRFNGVSVGVIVAALEIAAGLIWMWLR